MPRGDGTGPAGMGPMTGRAAGYCAGYPSAGFMNPGVGGGGAWGRGFGMGRGLGLGFRGGRGTRGFAPAGYAPPAYPAGVPQAAPAAEQESEVLREQIQHLENTLNAARNRLNEIETEEKK